MSTALITGASSGIGLALAREFAREGHDLIIVSEDEQGLAAAAAELGSGIAKVAVMPKDLSRTGAAQELYDEVRAKGLSVDFLVNDAGVGLKSDFARLPVGKLSEILHVNIFSTAMLTRLYLADMLARGTGKILNLGSIAGFEPGPTMAAYNASKAFINSLCDAIAEEIKDTPVTITCLAPGPVDTPFFERAGMADAFVRQPSIMMSPEEVARQGFEAMMQGERIAVPGAMNKVLVFSRRIMSKPMQARINRKLYESAEEPA
jgi:short-subunit dehydrogenase